MSEISETNFNMLFMAATALFLSSYLLGALIVSVGEVYAQILSKAIRHKTLRGIAE